MCRKTIGINAGIIWNLLNNQQKWDIDKLKEASGLSEKDIYLAMGWLAREEKIEFESGLNGKDFFYLVIEYYF